MPVSEERIYVIENPMKDIGEEEKPIITRLRSKALRYFKKNYQITEKHQVQIMVSKKETIFVMRIKVW